MGPIFFLAGIAGAVYLWISAWRNKREVQKYEFENITDGGVVKFASFEDKKKFDWKRQRTFAFVMWGIGSIILGLVLAIKFTH